MLSRRFGKRSAVLAGEARPKSALCVPLIVGRRRRDRRDLAPEPRARARIQRGLDQRLLTTLAGSLSVALENARLFDETKRLLDQSDQRAAELALINDVQRGLAEQLDMQAMYDLVGDKIQEIFDAQVVDIGVLDEAAGLIHFPYTIERGVRFPDARQTPGDRLPPTRDRDAGAAPGQRAHRGGAVERRWAARRVSPTERRATRSALFGVPLVVGGRGDRRISLQNLDREHAFSEADVRLLTTLAGSLSVALENARLFEETRQRNAELALINDVQRGLAENLEMQAMYDLVGDRIQRDLRRAGRRHRRLDRDAELIRFPYTIERGVRFPDEPTPRSGDDGAHMCSRRGNRS